MDAPAHVGCLIEVRIIGIIEAEQKQKGKTEANNRLFSVAVHSYDHENLDTIDEVSKTLLSQVEAFFVSYNLQRGKVFKILGTGRPKRPSSFSRRVLRRIHGKPGPIRRRKSEQGRLFGAASRSRGRR